ncbi:MAG: tRNA (adenosine(37)-N6)-threonylcarbamoyltransferase complex dimerization subunit type 1 TsaB [Candidatus Dependentiae bacterium]|nr:tRNA (adenosine(37)-N6)-threonylcarbamoyltransferase complex dimerization subunit type 1 TsaB [Candidatus Dependentiae bacterium]
MSTFLSIQNTYESLDVALFKDGAMIEWITEDKIRASKHFVLLLNGLLVTHKLKLSDISFIAVNQGPGPFTTLRTVIASVNGLSFATQIPLIGVDALDAFLIEQHNPDYSNTVVLLNAFNNDVYFGIQQSNNNDAEKGYENITALLQRIQSMLPDQPIRFLGNGTLLHLAEIQKTFGDRAIIPDPLPHTCSVESIGLLGLQKWQKKEGLAHELFPLYLKTSAPNIILR